MVGNVVPPEGEEMMMIGLSQKGCYECDFEGWNDLDNKQNKDDATILGYIRWNKTCGFFI